jgi:hypothetical protein
MAKKIDNLTSKQVHNYYVLLVIVLFVIIVLYVCFELTRERFVIKEEKCINVSDYSEHDVSTLRESLKASSFNILTYKIEYVFNKCNLPSDIFNHYMYDTNSVTSKIANDTEQLKCLRTLLQLKDETQKNKIMQEELKDTLAQTREVCNYTKVSNMTTGYCEHLTLDSAITVKTGDKAEYYVDEDGEYICVNYNFIDKSKLSFSLLETEDGCYCESGYDCKTEYQCSDCYSAQGLPLPKCVELDYKSCTRYRCFDKYIVEVLE